jgi:AcrR family transcriptional regulator
LFLAQGFDAASMNSIALEAGVSKGTLNVYFKSKEELSDATIQRHQPTSDRVAKSSKR